MATAPDIFSDLLPQKPSNGDGENSPAFSEDPVLLNPGSLRVQPKNPMSGTPMRKENSKEISDGAAQAAVKKLSESLQSTLDDIVRRLEALDARTEQIAQAVAELQEVEGLREDAARGRGTAVERSLREVQRSVQIIRDKMELADATAELAKLSSDPNVISNHATKSLVAASPEPSTAEPSAPAVAAATPPAPAVAPSQEAQPQPPQPQYSSQQQSTAAVVAPSPLPQAAPIVDDHQPQQAYSGGSPAAYSSAPPGPFAPVPPPPPHAGAVPPPPPHGGPFQPPPPHPPHVPSPGTAPSPPPSLHHHAPHAPPPSIPHHPPPPPPHHHAPHAPPPGPYGGPPAPPPPAMYASSAGSAGSGGISYPTMPPTPYNSTSYAPIPPPPAAYARPSPPPQQQSATLQPQARTASVSIERVIDDVAVMGFSRDQVRRVLQELQAQGKPVDLNVVLDRLGAR